MNPQEYARMHALETDYWWFAGRRAIIASLLGVAGDARSGAPSASGENTREEGRGRRMSTHAAATFASSPQTPSFQLLDIGCGTGANLPLLMRFVGPRGRVTGLDFSLLALRFAHDDLARNAAIPTGTSDLRNELELNGRGFGARMEEEDVFVSRNGSDGAVSSEESFAGSRVSLLRGDALRLPFPDASFDIVTMLDVLEHLSDDRRALSEVGRVLRPGGALVWSVPAYQKLWSAHDEALHHFRRYENRALRRLMRDSGFEVQLLSFAMSLMPPLAWLWRRLVLPFQPRRPRDAKRHSEGAVLPSVPPAWNRALVAYLALEGRIIARRPLRFGTSLVGIARKKRD